MKRLERTVAVEQLELALTITRDTSIAVSAIARAVTAAAVAGHDADAAELDRVGAELVAILERQS